MSAYPRSTPKLGGLDLDEFLSRFGRHGIARFAAVLDIKVDRLPNVLQRLVAIIALADASRQRRDAGDVPAVRFLFQDHRVAHRIAPFARILLGVRTLSIANRSQTHMMPL